MTLLGPLIKNRRIELGMSRPVLAARLGVSVQTIVNIEQDGEYNLGTALLRRLEPILWVEFAVEMRSKIMENTQIRMGNDEFILYIRKWHPACTKGNPMIAKEATQWLLRQDPPAQMIEEDKPAIWGDLHHFPRLPATAAQFEFDRSLLPALFTHLDHIGA